MASDTQNKSEMARLEKLHKAIMGMKFEKTALASMTRKKKAREKINILLVEDDILIRSLVTNTLIKNFETLPVGFGHQALSKYILFAPDIVFLDIHLPDINGLDLLKKILEIDPDAYVVMLSSDQGPANIAKAMENGAKGFIGKPFTREKLFSHIKQYTQQSLEVQYEIPV